MEEVGLDLAVVGGDVGLGGGQPGVAQQFLDGGDGDIGLNQVVGEGVAQLMGGDMDTGCVTVAHEALVDGGGGQCRWLVAEEDGSRPAIGRSAR